MMLYALGLEVYERDDLVSCDCAIIRLNVMRVLSITDMMQVIVLCCITREHSLSFSEVLFDRVQLLCVFIYDIL